MKAKRIGVILPAYNEASVLKEVLTGIPSTLTVQKRNYEVIPIVIDDGSMDATTKIARSHGAVTITHIINAGAGAATRTGIRYVREHGYDLCATMDADGQHRPEDLKNVLEAVIRKRGDVVIGSRLVNTLGMPWYKVVGNKGLNFTTRILLGVKTTDSQSGLKGFDRLAIERLDYRENGYAFCSELLWRAQKAHLKIVDIPIDAVYTDYSKGKGQSSWNGFHIVKQLVKHRLTDLVHE